METTTDTGPDFEAYLSSKKIDAGAFRDAEPQLWETWKKEFGEMHPNSFTVQKLNLINPIRRKYPLAATPVAKPPEEPAPRPLPSASKPGRPVIRPRPKTGGE